MVLQQKKYCVSSLRSETRTLTAQRLTAMSVSEEVEFHQNAYSQAIYLIAIWPSSGFEKHPDTRTSLADKGQYDMILMIRVVYSGTEAEMLGRFDVSDELETTQSWPCDANGFCLPRSGFEYCFLPN